METIKSSASISELFSHGKRFHGSHITLIVKKRASSDEAGKILQHDLSGRVAFIAGKKLGNAVWRNKAKRRMRAICFDLGGPWQGYDVVFLAKSSVNNAVYSKLREECKRVADKAFSSKGNL